MLKHYIRFKMEHSTNSFKNDPSLLNKLEHYNFYSLIIVYCSAFGVIVIGNFRVTECPFGHFFGVTFAFGGMLLYMCYMV